MIIFGLITLICGHPTSAVGITGLTLFTDKLELKLHSWNLVPCRFYSDTPILPNQLHLEWGKTIDEGRTYIPLIQVSGKTVKKSKKRHQVYVNVISNGNCSLVINPAMNMDSGIYEVRLTLDGVLYKPIPKIRVQPLTSETTVRLQKRDTIGEEQSTYFDERSLQDLQETETTEKVTYVFLKYEKYYITAIVIMSLFTLLGPLGWYLYFMELRRLEKKKLPGEPIKLNERALEENIQKDTNEAKENSEQNSVAPTEKPDVITEPKKKK
ncbi:hypothetical protein XELAEV_18031848mg [Xenopus laevis]|uniref:Uncharacterized protein n=1 Tax=Xenopus laevis TaxID=8355 RepID=A0A974CNL1_XENLA|nr:hypothetical protein XELAEV_18031848mg [Xenopus laevis]